MAEQQLIGAFEAGGTKMVCATGYADGTVLEQQHGATLTCWAPSKTSSIFPAATAPTSTSPAWARSPLVAPRASLTWCI